MTVINRFFRTIEPEPMTASRRAKMAGELIRACEVLGYRFEGTHAGWRVIVDRVHEHRAMVAEDLGLDP